MPKNDPMNVVSIPRRPTFGRLETRAQLRAQSETIVRAYRRVEGRIPERYVPEADHLDFIVTWGNVVERLFWLAVCAFGLTFGVIVGKSLVSAIFFAIWG